MTISDATQLTIPAEIDLAVARYVRQALVEHVQAQPSDEVAIDVSGVTFIDSSGLQALIDVTKATGKRLRLVGVRDECRRVFELTDTARLFGIV